MNINKNRHPVYWYWDKFIPDKLIDLLLEECKTYPKENGTTAKDRLSDALTNPDKNIRDSDIILLQSAHWFGSILANMAVLSNINAGYNYNLIIPETFQVAYYGINQHYGWHTDTDFFEKEYTTRKLTIICMLSNNTDYEGGEFELENGEVLKMDRGDIVVFPSFVQHRVRPVTKGLRISGTLWYRGDRSI